jgi:polyphosphate kinase 2 (PPK2 family)
VKFFLHISREEQKQRLEERLADKEKHWKFDRADLAVRAKWDLYQQAYEEMLAKTSTPHAPWYVIPSNKKWYRNLVISKVLVECLEGMGLSYPAPQDLSGIKIN